MDNFYKNQEVLYRECDGNTMLYRLRSKAVYTIIKCRRCDFHEQLNDDGYCDECQELIDEEKYAL